MYRIVVIPIWRQDVESGRTGPVVVFCLARISCWVLVPVQERFSRLFWISSANSLTVLRCAQDLPTQARSALGSKLSTISWWDPPFVWHASTNRFCRLRAVQPYFRPRRSLRALPRAPSPPRAKCQGIQINEYTRPPTYARLV